MAGRKPGWNRPLVHETEAKILRLHAEDGLAPAILAERFGLNIKTIYRILNHKEVLRERS